MCMCVVVCVVVYVYVCVWLSVCVRVACEAVGEADGERLCSTPTGWIWLLRLQLKGVYPGVEVELRVNKDV